MDNNGSQSKVYTGPVDVFLESERESCGLTDGT